MWLFVVRRPPRQVAIEVLVVTAPQGFTLVEFLVATAITLVAIGLAVALVAPAGTAFHALPEAADQLQRLRVATDALRTDLAAAGSGPSLGWGSGAPQTWPTILPCRWTGTPLASIAGGCSRSDSITVFSMASAAPQAMLDAAVAAPSASMSITPVSACNLSAPACRLRADTLVLVIDGSSAWDIAPVRTVSTDGRLLSLARVVSGSFAAGALVGEINAKTYYPASEAGTNVPQLRRAEDAGNSNAVIDHLASLSFQYFGAGEPPRLIDSGNPAIRAATYGPVPPPVAIDNPLDAWPPGENCSFVVADGAQVSRLATLPTDESGLALLPLSMFGDGPWCPDAMSPNRFDADLLRIRLVRVMLRVEAQSSTVRGAFGPRFARPGSATEATRLVPDVSVSFDVAVRNSRR